MEIQKTNFASNHTSFGMRFIKNVCFTDTVKYAEKNGKLLNLDAALNLLKNVKIITQNYRKLRNCVILIV